MTATPYVGPEHVVAVVLAGGMGDRLGGLTWYRGKPAVPTGNTVMISHATSSAINAGIEKVIVAVQYLPLSIERFLSNSYGADYGPDKKMQVIGPYHTMRGAAEFKGTAHALYHSIGIAKRSGKKYLLVLSGDHMYNYKFSELFETFHQKYDSNSLVILSQPVNPDNPDEARDFGIIETREGTTQVVNFLEKPDAREITKPIEAYQKNLGIYFGSIELWERELGRELSTSRAQDLKETDIGKNLMPRIVAEGKVPVHVFSSDFFWADLGRLPEFYKVVRSVFLDRDPDIYGSSEWPIQAVGEHHLVSSDGSRYFHSGRIQGDRNSHLDGSVFSPGVHLDRASVLDSIVFGGPDDAPVSVHYGAHIQRAIIDKGCSTNPDAVVRSEQGLVVVVKGTRIPHGTKIEARGDALVADMGELTSQLDTIQRYFKKVGPTELFAPNGTKIELEELVEERARHH